MVGYKGSNQTKKQRDKGFGALCWSEIPYGCSWIRRCKRSVHNKGAKTIRKRSNKEYLT